MSPRVPLKRSTSVDTIDTAVSFDTTDIETTFVDRVCTKMKKAASPFSTLFVAGSNRAALNDTTVVKEKRGGISLSSLIRKGSDHCTKATACDQSVYSEETPDIWKLIDSMVATEESEHDQSLYGDEESDDSKDEHVYSNSCSSGDDNSSQSEAVALKRRVHHRSTFDNEFKRREDERHSARVTAAALVRQRNLHRQASVGDCSRNSELGHRSHHRSSGVRKPRRSRSVDVQ